MRTCAASFAVSASTLSLAGARTVGAFYTGHANGSAGAAQQMLRADAFKATRGSSMALAIRMSAYWVIEQGREPAVFFRQLATHFAQTTTLFFEGTSIAAAVE